MTFRLRHLLLAPTLGLTLVASGASIGFAVGKADPEPIIVIREPLAQSTVVQGVKNRTLSLGRVTVMPGAKLASHHHPGTQVAYIANGTLTYTVETGKVVVMRGSAEDPTVVRTIRAGQTGQIRTGSWIAEQPSEVHHAANKGTVPVVIYLSTLFRTGAPASLPN